MFTGGRLIAEQSIGQYLLWVAILIGVVMVATSVILLVRKKLLDPSAQFHRPAGIMEELRSLRDQGKISEEEFAAARQKMVRRIAADAVDKGLPENAPPQQRPRPLPRPPGKAPGP